MRVGEIVDRASLYWYRVSPEYEEAFRSPGLQPVFNYVERSDAIAGAFAEISSRRAVAFIVRGDRKLRNGPSGPGIRSSSGFEELDFQMLMGKVDTTRSASLPAGVPRVARASSRATGR
jgi:hypothetical protein